MNNKVSKIEMDHIKQGCHCEYFEGRNRIYITKVCKFCKIKKAVS